MRYLPTKTHRQQMVRIQQQLDYDNKVLNYNQRKLNKKFKRAKKEIDYKDKQERKANPSPFVQMMKSVVGTVGGVLIWFALLYFGINSFVTAIDASTLLVTLLIGKGLIAAMNAGHASTTNKNKKKGKSK